MLPQLFLACGWLRVATEHAIDRSWWSGTALTEFVGSADTKMSIGFYEPFLDAIVQIPALISVVVLVTELAVGVMLALNARPLIALVAGGFLNVQFMLAGVVNPSAFYLILAFIGIQWRMERELSPVKSWRAARWSALFAAAMFVLFALYISTLHPAMAMEDPALVLIFLSALFALGARCTHKRIVAKAVLARQRTVHAKTDHRANGVSRRSVNGATPSTGPLRPRQTMRPGGSR